MSPMISNAVFHHIYYLFIFRLSQTYLQWLSGEKFYLLMRSKCTSLKTNLKSILLSIGLIYKFLKVKIHSHEEGKLYFNTNFTYLI